MTMWVQSILAMVLVAILAVVAYAVTAGVLVPLIHVMHRGIDRGADWLASKRAR
jgi:hypothetical protein